jgi:tetratricopeptide (TPR) repeat protein
MSKKIQHRNTPQTNTVPADGKKWVVPDNFLLLWCLLLTFAVFFNTLGAGFVNWDDHGYLWLNSLIQPLSGEAVAGMFTGHTCGNYSPLVVLTYSIEHIFDPVVKPGAMVADNFNPFTYHLTNVLLHLGATAMSFFLFRALGLRSWALGIATVLFGIHPMRSESVAWVTERKDVLYGLFYIGALFSYWKFLSEPAGKTRWMVWTVVLGVLSYFSKIQAVSLPLSLICLDYYHGRDIRSWRVWIEKSHFWLLSLVIGLVGLHFLDVAEGFKDTGYSPLERFFFATYSLFNYLLKLVAPFDLSAYYPYPEKGALPVLYYVTPLALAGIGWWVWKSAGNGRTIVFAFLFFLVNIMFVLQFKGAGKAFMADRFTYIPYLGLFFALAHGYQSAMEGGVSPVFRRLLPYLAAGFIALFAFLTFRQNATWQSSLTLWENVTGKFPNDALSWNNYGLAYLDLDEDEKAAVVFEKGLKADPSSFDLLYNAGITMNRLGRYRDAIPYFDRLIAIRPDDANARFTRAQILLNAKEPVKAMADYRKALELGIKKPRYEVLEGIGKAAYNAGMYTEALEALNEAISEKDNFNCQYLRGNCLAATGRMNDALAAFGRSIELNPEFAEGYNNKANALASLRRFSEALPMYNKAIELKPGAPDFICNRGLAKKDSGDLQGACSDWKEAAGKGYATGAALLKQFCGQ